MITAGWGKETDDQVKQSRRLRRRPVWPFFVGPLIVKDYTWESKYIFTSHVSGRWAVFKVTRIRHTQFSLRNYVCVQAVIVKDWYSDLLGLLYVLGLIWCLERQIFQLLLYFLRRWRYLLWTWRRILQDTLFKVGFANIFCFFDYLFIHSCVMLIFRMIYIIYKNNFINISKVKFLNFVACFALVKIYLLWKVPTLNFFINLTFDGTL